MKYLQRVLVLLLLATTVKAEIPVDQIDKTKIVNDNAGLLSAGEWQRLEQKLVQYDRSSSSQIFVFTTDTLYGYDPVTLSAELGQKLGVGQKGKDNGIVILVKQKTASSRGHVFIATGYGMEHVVTDGVTKRIVEQEMIPYFKKNDYYTGIDNAVNRLIDLTSGEYTAEEFVNSPGGRSGVGSSFIIPLLIAAFIFGRIFLSFGAAKRMRRSSMGRSNLPLWLLFLSSISSGSRHGGSYSSFSSGSGSFGGFSGGGGGFGGFGGGSFGGGGAGGSW